MYRQGGRGTSILTLYIQYIYTLVIIVFIIYMHSTSTGSNKYTQMGYSTNYYRVVKEWKVEADRRTTVGVGRGVAP